MSSVSGFLLHPRIRHERNSLSLRQALLDGRMKQKVTEYSQYYTQAGTSRSFFAVFYDKGKERKIVMGIVLVLMRRALKKELLILHLLGVPQRSVARQFFGAAGIVGILSIVAGSGIAYVYAGYAVKRSLGAVDEALVSGKLDATQSMIMAGIVVLLFIMTLLMICLQHFRGTPMSKPQKTNKQ